MTKKTPEKKCLIVTSVSSMVGQFMMPNIDLLMSLGYDVTVATNFEFGSTFDSACANELLNALEKKNVIICNVSFVRSVFSFKNITAYRQIKKLVDKNNYSLIHCHSPIGGVIARLVARKKRSFGTKVIYTAHGFHFFKGASLVNWFLYYFTEKYLSKITDILITINKEDYDFACRKMQASKIRYVHGAGVDTKKFSEPVVDAKTKRNEIGIPLNSDVLISVGELTKRKNHQVIIKTMGKMKTKDLYYVICGQGKRIAGLRNLCRRLNLQNRVMFLGYRNDIADLLCMSNLYVFPSLQEGLSVSLMEAMAAKLPCVVSNIRGNVDLITDGEGGVLCSVNNIGEYKNAIEKLVVDIELRQKMGEYNQAVLRKFDTAIVLNQLEKIYNELLFLDSTGH